MKKTLDSHSLQLMNLFSSLSGVSVKDCLNAEQMIVFVVPEGDIGRAVGKGGVNVRKIEQKTRKKVKVVEHSADMLKFIKNVVAPLELNDISEEDNVVTMTPKDLKTRGLLIGRGASNLRFFESIVKRFFPVKELKVK
jgi:N utilization substance protein A